MKREASALVAIPLVVAAVFLPDRELFRWIVTALCLLALWEYAALCRLGGLLSAAVLAGGAVALSAAVSEGGLPFPGAALLIVLVASLWKVKDPAEGFRRSGEAVLGTVYISFAFTSLLLLRDLPLGRVAVLTLAVAASGQVGDLLQSLWKRAKGVKDSGKIIPGHGGLLDRIDSLLLGAPVGYQLIKAWVTGA